MSTSYKINDFTKSDIIEEILETAQVMSDRGWAERNAGNISCILLEEEVEKYFGQAEVKRSFDLDLNISDLAGKTLVITATGTYFRKLVKNPSVGLGVVRVSKDGNSIDLLWGFEGDNKPSSEMRMHFAGHIARLKVDPSHRVILHTHATHIVIMSTAELDEDAFTSALWRMHSECIVVFPDGIGLLPWMVPGTVEIGNATAEKLSEFRLVVWPLHGVIATGASIDEAMGLIEAAEKTAEIYIRSQSLQGVARIVTDTQLLKIAETFGVEPRKGIIDTQ